jgi:hypothetical protein
MSDEPKNKRSADIAEIVALPALATGAGTLLGGIGGGLLAREALQTPGVVSRLARMSPTKRDRVLAAVSGLLGSAAGTAAGVGSFTLAKHLQDKYENS